METKDLITIANVRGYVNENGIAMLNAEDVARGWGFTQIAKSGNEVVRWERINKYLSEFGFIPTSGDAITKDDFLPENIVYRLGFKASNETAQKFQTILVDEILPSIRKHNDSRQKERINMNELQVFKGKFGTVRTFNINGEPWFVGKDIADILGYEASRNAIVAHVDIEDRLTHQISASGQRRNVTIINESGLYSLIISSKLPQAKEFKHWVTSEILPSIRKHGGYIAGQEQMNDQELVAKALLVVHRQLEERNKQIEQKDKQIAIMQPKAEFYDTTASTDSLFSMADVCKILDMGIGRNKLFQMLRERGILRNNNTPYQRYVDAGYFKLVESQFEINGKTVVTATTYVKQKGVDYIRKLLKEEKAA